MSVLFFILQTNFAARRTFVRLRAGKIKSEALILLGLSVPHLFLSHKKGTVKKPGFLQYLFTSFFMSFFIAKNEMLKFGEL